MSVPDGTSPQRLVATVRGSVQGVGFRWFTQREASRLGVMGWVANQPDGSVEVVAEGRPEILEDLLALLRDGPSGASVSDILVRREPARGDLSDFHVRSGAHRGD